MKRKYLMPVLLVFFIGSIGGCAAFQTKDPVKAGLYSVKEEWLSIREYAIGENLQGRLSDAQLNEFKIKDSEFIKMYDLTVMLYLSSTTGVDFDSNIKTLRNFLLDARRNYYKGGQ